jgi:prepilin-type N-terminal cleavage/methylation domain-containing protein
VKRRNAETKKRRNDGVCKVLTETPSFRRFDVLTFRRFPRGMTLLELMLAMSITAMIGAAIVGMLGAVSTGVGARRDNRSTMVQAAAARSRLSSYLAPARCLLGVNNGDVTIWLDDSRESGSVHGSEIRWLRFDPSAQTISVFYVRFPDGWSQAACDLADDEHDAAGNWDSVLDMYAAKGLIDSMTLMDRVDSVAIQTNKPQPHDAQHLIFQLGLTTDAGSVAVSIPATISQHQVPEA